jgi:hypothetical protein
MNNQTTTINNRNFTLTEVTEKYAAMAQNLKTRGFDGTVWFGFSARARNQRNDLNSLIARSATTGQYVILASI